MAQQINQPQGIGATDIFGRPLTRDGGGNLVKGPQQTMQTQQAEGWQQAMNPGLSPENQAKADTTLSNLISGTPEKIKPFNEADYNASDYGDYARAQKEKIQTAYARQRNQMEASGQKMGTYGGGDTGLGLREALMGNAEQNQGVAAQIGKMQYGDKYGQWQNYAQGVNNRNENTVNWMNQNRQDYNANKEGAGNILGIAGGLWGSLVGGDVGAGIGYGAGKALGSSGGGKGKLTYNPNNQSYY